MFFPTFLELKTQNVETMELKERLIFLADTNNLAVSRFERICGLSNGYVKNIKGRLSAEKMEGILKAFPNVSRDWLINGTGDMYNKVEQPSSVTQYGSNVNTTGDNNHIEQSALLDKALGEISELRKALVDALQVNQRQAERLLDILQTYGNMSTFGGKADNK
jgi:hypothetical protein